MAEESNPQAEGQAEESNPQAEGQADGQRTGKGDDFSAQKYKKQRDDARSEIAQLQEQISSLKGESEELNKLKQQVKEQQDAITAEKQAAILVKAKSVVLAQAGCVDIDGAIKLWDDDSEIDDFKKAKPYLFKQSQPGSTGAAPAGAAEGHSALEAASRNSMKLKPKE